MKDREFLIWLHERFEHQHGVHPQTDYMQKLRSIIQDTDPDKDTPNVGTQISIGDLT